MLPAIQLIDWDTSLKEAAEGSVRNPTSRRASRISRPDQEPGAGGRVKIQNNPAIWSSAKGARYEGLDQCNVGSQSQSIRLPEESTNSKRAKWVRNSWESKMRGKSRRRLEDCRACLLTSHLKECAQIKIILVEENRG